MSSSRKMLWRRNFGAHVTETLDRMALLHPDHALLFPKSYIISSYEAKQLGPKTRVIVGAQFAAVITNLQRV